MNHYASTFTPLSTGCIAMCVACAAVEAESDAHNYEHLINRYEPIVMPLASPEMDIAIECALHTLAGAA